MCFKIKHFHFYNKNNNNTALTKKYKNRTNFISVCFWFETILLTYFIINKSINLPLIPKQKNQNDYINKFKSNRENLFNDVVFAPSIF